MTTLSLIPLPSFAAIKTQSQEKAWDCASTRSVPLHTLCEQNADDLAKTLEAVEEKFGPWLSKIKWLNMGGGHHITRDDYDRELLIKCIRHIRDTYGVEVYLEPGEAIALNAGYLVTEVMDIVEKAFTYRLSSCTCLAGDVIGDYSFDKQIHVGDKLYFQDMAIYSMVKNNTFNGIPLPGIAVMKEDGDCELIRTFGYGDFKGRLA